LLLLPHPAATVTAANAIRAISTVSLCLISRSPPLGLGYGTDVISAALRRHFPFVLLHFLK
jgi:hypothetical protein